MASSSQCKLIRPVHGSGPVQSDKRANLLVGDVTVTVFKFVLDLDINSVA